MATEDTYDGGFNYGPRRYDTENPLDTSMVNQYDTWNSQIQADPSLQSMYGTAGFIAPGQYPGLYGGLEGRLYGMDELFSNDYRATPASADYLASRDAFTQAFPGYAQLTPDQMTQNGDTGQWGYKTAGASQGQYIIDPSKIIQDPTYGSLSPVNNFGASGNPGTFWDESTMMVLAAMGGIAGVTAPATGLFGAGAGASGAGAVDMGVGGFGASGSAAGASAEYAAFGAGGGGGLVSEFSWSDPSTWFNSPPTSGLTGGSDASWGVNPQGGDMAGQQAIDGSAQSIYDAMAGSGAPGYDAALSSTAGGSGFSLGGLVDWAKANPQLAAQIFGAGSNILTTLLSTNAQGKAADQASQTQMAMYNQNRADMEPWRQAGLGALSQLTNLTTPGNQMDAMMLDPGYQFRQQQGQQALDNQAKAAGRFYSGNQIKDTARFNQDYATNEFSNVYNRLAGLAGTGQTATQNIGQYGQNTANNVAANQLSAGANNASGYRGVGDSVTGGISNYLNYSNSKELLDLLIKSQRRA